MMTPTCQYHCESCGEPGAEARRVFLYIGGHTGDHERRVIVCPDYEGCMTRVDHLIANDALFLAQMDAARFNAALEAAPRPGVLSTGGSR